MLCEKCGFRDLDRYEVGRWYHYYLCDDLVRTCDKQVSPLWTVSCWRGLLVARPCLPEGACDTLGFLLPDGRIAVGKCDWFTEHLTQGLGRLFVVAGIWPGLTAVMRVSRDVLRVSLLGRHSTCGTDLFYERGRLLEPAEVAALLV